MSVTTAPATVTNTPKLLCRTDEGIGFYLERPGAVARAIGERVLAPTIRDGETAEQLGTEVLAALYACLMAVDRVLSLEHLMYAVSVWSDCIDDGTADEHAWDRDRAALGFMLAGTMHEAGKAMARLSRSMREQLRDTESFGQLEVFRAQWRDHPFASRVRNNYAFHLGAPSFYAAGIRLTGDDTLTLFESRGQLRYAGRYFAPWTTLMRGHEHLDRERDREVEDWETFIRRTRDAHNELPDRIMAVFREVLEAAGVPTEMITTTPANAIY